MKYLYELTYLCYVWIKIGKTTLAIIKGQFPIPTPHYMRITLTFIFWRWTNMFALFFAIFLTIIVAFPNSCICNSLVVMASSKLQDIWDFNYFLLLLNCICLHFLLIYFCTYNNINRYGFLHSGQETLDIFIIDRLFQMHLDSNVTSGYEKCFQQD